MALHAFSLQMGTFLCDLVEKYVTQGDFVCAISHTRLDGCAKRAPMFEPSARSRFGARMPIRRA